MPGAPAIKQVRQLYSPTASDIHFVRDMSFGRDMRYARLLFHLLRIKSRICIIRHIFLLKLGYISVKKRWYTIRRNKVCGKDASRI